MSETTSTTDLGAATILDPQGREVPIATLWATRPVVLAFVRHFG